MLTSFRHSVGFGIAMILACGSAASAQVQTFFTFEKADFSTFLSDPRDKKFAEAWGMLPARIAELPREVPNGGDKADLFVTGVRLIQRPIRLAVTYNAGYPAGGMFGYGVVVSLAGKNEGEVKDLAGKVADLLKQADMPVEIKPCERYKSFSELQTPIGVVAWGPRQDKDAWSYDIVAGAVDQLGPVFAKFPTDTPPGFERVWMRATFDLSALTPAVTFAQTMVGNNQQQASQVNTVVKELTAMGLIGPDALRGRIDMGQSADATVTRLVVENAGKSAEKLGLSKGVLTKADLAAIPSDASLAMVSKADLSFFDRMIDELKKNGLPVDQALDSIKEETGAALREDILQTLGGTAAIYMSDSTGGGGLGSLVLMMSFKDRAKFLAAHDKLVAKAKALIAENEPDAERYIQMSTWKEGAADLFSVRPAGLPFPLELTYAATDKWLIIGLIPQAVQAAARQAQATDGGLTKNPTVTALLRDDRPLTALTYGDAPRYARNGYPLVALFGQAVANGVRSPLGGREPGYVVPSFHELMSGVKPHTQITYWQGEKYIVESSADKSLLANLSTVGGALSEFAPLAAIPALIAFSEPNGMVEGPADHTRLWALSIMRAAEPRLSVLSPSRMLSLGINTADLNAWANDPWARARELMDPAAQR